jgi:hypothetical protein
MGKLAGLPSSIFYPLSSIFYFSAVGGTTRVLSLPSVVYSAGKEVRAKGGLNVAMVKSNFS